MTISAKVIEDSTNSLNERITTFVLEYPRFIHAEFMTHRVFSRNAASSRAIPIEKMIQKVIDDPAMPIYWGKNQKGMQANEELTEDQIHYAKIEWLKARDRAVESAKMLSSMMVHKQISNRALEPYLNIKVICTGTAYENFFALRDHPDAQPEIRELARCMKEALRSSVAKPLGENEWHLPFVTDEERLNSALDTNLIRSAARCARVSYDRVEGGSSDLQNDIRIFTQLTSSKPPHSSPLEHQATPGIGQNYYNLFSWKNLRWFADRDPSYIPNMLQDRIT